MNNVIINELVDEAASEQWASKIKFCLSPPCVIGFSGELGAGKTTLIRALLRCFGIKGPIKSPTYSLVESYDYNDWQVHHFDLYRIAHDEELSLIGFRDYLNDKAICCIEWPTKAYSAMKVVDVQIDITIMKRGRKVAVTEKTKQGDAFVHCLRGQQ